MENHPQDYKYWLDRPEVDNGDWLDTDGNWVANYWESKNHPHRQLIIQALRNAGNIKSVLDVGCCSGPNLQLIKEELSIEEKELAGIDANQWAVNFARQKLPNADIRHEDLIFLPAPFVRTFDAVICDASLMYVSPKQVKSVLEGINLITNHAVVIIDRFAYSELGELTSGGHIWARDYEKLLNQLGFEVTKTKLLKEDWPTSERWVRDGWVWLGVRP